MKCSVQQTKNFSEPVVEAEFFDPKYRGELEQRDAEMVRKTGKGSANGDEWVWLTQYCRIPVQTVKVLVLFL